jgi:cytochrome bd-type quinol oxidase subunit 2
METFLGIDYPTLWYLVVGLLFMTQGAIFLLLKTKGRLHARLTFLLKKGMIFLSQVLQLHHFIL